MPIAQMAEKFPDAYETVRRMYARLLKTTTETCRIWNLPLNTANSIMLQTRNGKRTAQAALKIACDLVDEGMRTEEEAVAMIDPSNLDTLAPPSV